MCGRASSANERVVFVDMMAYRVVRMGLYLSTFYKWIDEWMQTRESGSDDAQSDGVVVELLTQDLTSSKEPAHDGSDRDRQFFGNLAVGFILEIGHDDDGTEIVGDVVEGIADFIAEIVLHDFEVFVGDIGVARVGEVFVERLAAIDHRAFALRMAILGDEFVHHDAAEPCFAIRTRFVFIEVFTCADERILDEVFGVFFVVREAERIRHQRVLVAHGFGLE